MHSIPRPALHGLVLLGALCLTRTASAAEFRPSCAAVQDSFQAGPFDRREAIVDALQDHLADGNANKLLGRDGKVQAIVMAVLRCQALGGGDFMHALDQTVAQVEQESAARHGHD